MNEGSSDPKKFTSIVLTRQAVARSQIDTAIELTLAQREPVASNTLTWAANDMLRGVAKTKEIDTFQVILESRIHPEFVKQWRGILRSHYNFAKHADRDPDRVVEDFKPEATSWALFGVCWDYAQIFALRSWAMFVYQQWFLCRNPNIAGDEMQQVLPVISKHFDHPSEKKFENSTADALELLQTGRSRSDEIETILGENWRGKIEW